MALAAQTRSLRAAARTTRPASRSAVKVMASSRVDRYISLGQMGQFTIATHANENSGRTIARRTPKTEIVVSPSILSANFSKLGEEVR